GVSDLRLGPLQDNGGDTFTHALLNGSPAIDAGDTALTTDQRGISRPQGTADDIGAFELVQYDCAIEPWIVDEEADLHDAIRCFNSQTIADSYTISLTQNISLTISTIDIDNTAGVGLLLEGNSFTVDGQDNLGVRPFEIAIDTTVTIQNITITGGNIANPGGGIRNSGTLTVSNSTLSGNSSTSDGGGIYNRRGTLTVSNSTLSGNSAAISGGGIYNRSGTLTVSNSTLSGNSATNDGGGGIYNFGGTLTVSNSIISDSTSGGDCINNEGTVNNYGFNIVEDGSCGFTGVSDLRLGPLQDNGGDTFTHALLNGSPAIDAGDTALTTDQRGISRPQGAADDIGAFELVQYDCAIEPWIVDEEADLNGAIGCFNNQTIADSYIISLTQNISLITSTVDIDNNTAGVELLLEGNSFTIDGQDYLGVRPFYIATNSTVTIQNMTITGGNTSSGGGISNDGTLTVSNSTLRGNSVYAYGGGGILNEGTLTVSNSTLSDNSAYAGGGGITNSGTLTISNSTLSGNSVGWSGGGIDNYGMLTISNSTLSGNSADWSGGGIYNFSTLIISNSTLSDNFAAGGGGIYNVGGTLAVSNSTLSGNSADYDGGGGIFNGGTLTVNNSIISDSTPGGDCYNNSGTITSNGYNLDSDGTCNWSETTDISSSDPLLGPLQDNGGDTFTHALLDGSPAIDAGDTTLTTDQRGVARPQGNADDIGAYEDEGGIVQYEIFLPFITKPGYPDLVVDSISVTGDADVSIVIRNSGTAAVTEEFWVDLYIGLKNSGNPPMQVNDIWQNLSPNGAAWEVTTSALPLNVGDTLTLTVNDAYFDTSESNIGSSIANNTNLYVQVDSANAGNSNGGVLESHEQNGGAYNNVFGPVTR
ncbi:MAG: hypothetical protein GY805_17955, partial [Chloroflexi bacterium]|nr:hypothetical protein [Chloroflexota bacterium]